MGHHVVPQRYLKGFQAKERPLFIWMFDKEQNSAKLLPIKQVAQVPEFYANDVEAALNTEAEIPGNDVIDKLRRGEALEEIDRRHLTYYIATMITRVPAARARAATFIPTALDDVARATRKAIRDSAKSLAVDEATMNARMAEVEAVKRAVPETAATTGHESHRDAMAFRELACPHLQHDVASPSHGRPVILPDQRQSHHPSWWSGAKYSYLRTDLPSEQGVDAALFVAGRPGIGAPFRLAGVR